MTDKEKFEKEVDEVTNNPLTKIELNALWYLFKQKEIDARIKQLEDAKTYTESKLGCGYNSFTEEVLIEMARQYQHLISELEKEL